MQGVNQITALLVLVIKKAKKRLYIEVSEIEKNTIFSVIIWFSDIASTLYFEH